MPLYDATTKVRREHPSEADTWFDFKPLSGREARKAKAVQAERAMAMVANMPPDRLAALQSQARSNGKALGPEQTYDIDTVLASCIVGWSYEQPVSDVVIAFLDEPTSDWAFCEIMALSLRDASEGEAFGARSKPISDPAPVASPSS